MSSQDLRSLISSINRIDGVKLNSKLKYALLDAQTLTESSRVGIVQQQLQEGIDQLALDVLGSHYHLYEESKNQSPENIQQQINQKLSEVPTEYRDQAHGLGMTFQKLKKNFTNKMPTAIGSLVLAALSVLAMSGGGGMFDRTSQDPSQVVNDTEEALGQLDNVITKMQYRVGDKIDYDNRQETEKYNAALDNIRNTQQQMIQNLGTDAAPKPGEYNRY